jgi:hypothetical protein
MYPDKTGLQIKGYITGPVILHNSKQISDLAINCMRTILWSGFWKLKEKTWNIGYDVEISTPSVFLKAKYCLHYFKCDAI